MVMPGRYLWASPGTGTRIFAHILLARTQSFLFAQEGTPNCKGGWEMWPSLYPVRRENEFESLSQILPSIFT